ncbi:MAG: hypothetical protein JW881_03050 [Spirochaetales bacterium]|nr:hypothetical protein [Spirochaetales bacterium]
MPLYNQLKWIGPYRLSTIDFKKINIPAGSGVYVFTEYPDPLKPNPRLPSETDPNYVKAIDKMRITPSVVYVGKAKDLHTRLPGYKFRPYLEIKRHGGRPPKHKTSRHKGRALLHASQYFNGTLFLRWAYLPLCSILSKETQLIKELRPALNTMGM